MAAKPPENVRRSARARALLLTLGAFGLVIVAVWFRCRCLGNLPGVNGDEAWYGAQAVEMLRGGSFWARTPTGNPPNLLFLIPLVLLHVWLPPSVELLRLVAVASGLAALMVNWLLCRWVFDRATAAVSTVLLAVWPVSIVYSRFAWDASQSVLATLPVVYLSLAMLRFPARRWQLVPATVVAIGAAVWVHPTNVFVAALTAAAVSLRPRQARQPRPAAARNRRRLAAAALLLALLGAGVGWAFAGGTAGRWLGRAGGIDDLTRRGGLWHVPALVARLHTGQTAYRFIPGSRSWLAWPSAEETGPWGVDVVVFWAALAAVAVVVWRSGTEGQGAGVRGQGARDGSQGAGGRSQGAGGRGQGAAERALLMGWALTLVGFLVVAGPSAMLPGWERYALCLVAPTTLLLARGAVLAYRAGSPRGQWALAAGSLLGWVLLADFEVHYFRFLRETGGQAHATFRTGPAEPKAAALRWIAAQRPPAADDPGPAWIVTTEWWNYWPLRYLASDQRDIEVLNWKEAESRRGLPSALGEGRVFLVEFAGSPAEQRALARAAELSPAIDPQRWLVRGYGDAPVLCVLEFR